MYSLFYNQFPFERETNNAHEFENEVIDFHNDEEEFENISEEAKDLIKCMLSRDPDQRPSAQQALVHPFFQLYPNVPNQNNAAIFQAINDDDQIYF